MTRDRGLPETVTGVLISQQLSVTTMFKAGGTNPYDEIVGKSQHLPENGRLAHVLPQLRQPMRTSRGRTGS